MIIVMLPGLDGTGDLFEDLIPYFGEKKVKVIPLPQSGEQSYQLLAEYVMTRLPARDFILVAESFSGPIGAILAGKAIESMKGIVFVATFLTPPKKGLLALSKLLPVNKIISFPLSSLVVRYFLLGQEASTLVSKRFFQVVATVPDVVFKRRLSSVQKFKLKPCTIDLPATYICAEYDKLVPKEKCLEFHHYFSRLKIELVSGPHFILQANPSECAKIIVDKANL